MIETFKYVLELTVKSRTWDKPSGVWTTRL